MTDDEEDEDDRALDEILEEEDRLEEKIRQSNKWWELLKFGLFVVALFVIALVYANLANP